MAKSLRSKHVRRMKAAKREKYGKREHDRLITMLVKAGDYQVVPKVKEEPMDPVEIVPSEEVDLTMTSPVKTKEVTPRRSTRGRKARKDTQVEAEEVVVEVPIEEPMSVSTTAGEDGVVRVYSRKTKRDQFGNYPPWMSVRKVTKHKKRNKRLHNQKRKINKARKIR